MGDTIEQQAGQPTPTPGSERLHALDAVRGFALLLGILLHASAAFVEDVPIPLWAERPAAVPTLVYWGIHVFRMSAFFLMAGFFGRLLLERRGTRAFARDRAKRIALPLVLALGVLPVLSGLAAVLGALPHGGIGYLQSLLPPSPLALSPKGEPVAGQGLNLSIYWFLYYLLIFYALALAARALDRRARVAAGVDRAVGLVMAGPWAPIVVALPVAAAFLLNPDWTQWLGLPAPISFVPDLFAIAGYGVPFALGWFLHRQVPLLLGVQRHWLAYLVAAVALATLSLWLVGTKPVWSGGPLEGPRLAAYALAYALATWCSVFGLVGAALRFLSRPSPTIRYLSDASYWLYLTHLIPLVFFIVLMKPYDWHWTIKLAIMLGGSLPLLLLSYRYLVRATWIGAMLNGRRYPRRSQPEAAVGTA
jgi:peptidoglycan/LPS O-acetylase OafA/YrhL